MEEWAKGQREVNMRNDEEEVVNTFDESAVYSAIRNTALTWCLEKKGPVFVAMFAPVQIVFAVILGVTFLGDSLHLGSAIGATIVAAGFYTVMWGQVIEKNKLPVDLVASEENGSSNPNTPLLSSLNESKC
ncbi:eamA domain, WAT1-related protein [Artemisia annua]|uniref:EamA domain, WAT1-related protein n=1 Tax=Artemisia annua TaxID=35608 RepID=A0A2U1NEK6_ARTAN|nr:eamA domain, WAT1-related protein [Artemisia annua]